MQPPPQTVPAGAGGPPPAGISCNTYWRNSPFSRRANAPVSGATAPVQPVTDPFAFGRQTPQGSLLGNPSKGNPLVPPGPTPSVFPRPAAVHSSPSYAGENSHGLPTSLPTSASQPGTNSKTFSNVVIPSSPARIINSTAEMHPNAEHGRYNSSAQSLCNTGATPENSVSGHVANRPPSRQDINRDPSNTNSVPTVAPFLPPPLQQTPPQWRSSRENLQPQVHNYWPYVEPPSQNAVYSVAHSSAVTSHLPPQAILHQSPVRQHVPQSTMQAPSPIGHEKNEISSFPVANHHVNSFQPENMFRQNTGMTNPWSGPPYQEPFYPQPLLPDSGFVNPIAQENNPKNQSQNVSETSSGQTSTHADSGTISMFFKGDEAENEEILSSETHDLSGKANLDACQLSSGHTYHQPLHPQQAAANVLSQSQVSIGSANETVQKVPDAPYSSKTISNQPDTQVSKNSMYINDDKANVSKAHGNVGSHYENVENLECIQNQEVLPGEPQNINCSSPSVGSDLYRYGPLPGPLLPKNTNVSHTGGGPNLEAPDSLPHPVRSDSVSSNYSNISHRSVSSSTRPQELVGTFIQQESGKPDESSTSFFKQIDSSPLGGDSSEPHVSKNYHSNLSQPPTPSPPKPTGIFQASANSSFEPVRSHGVGVKPAEVDQAKMVVERRENQSNQKNIKINTAVPAASPGNLEQPPDNLETIFMPQVHPLSLSVTGEPGNMLQPVSGPVVENIQLIPEKRPSTRAQGATKKCESPATTLWAQNELPNFGGNVLLAPAAPAVYVPAKQTVEIIQPPEEGLSSQQPTKPESSLVQPSQHGNVSSENLENPPKIGEEETLQSQASSGYASLLSSPPTESLQNQPILIAQPNQSYNLAQPINFSISSCNQVARNENNLSLKDPGVEDKSVTGLQAPHAGGILSGESVPLSMMQVGSLVNTPQSSNPSHSSLLQSPVHSSEITSNQSTNLLMQPPSQTPLNLAPEAQRNASSEGCQPEFTSKPGSNSTVPPGINIPSGNANVVLVPPVNTMVPNNNSTNDSYSHEEASGALDFTVTRTLEKSKTSNSVQIHNPLLSCGLVFPQQPVNHASSVGPDTYDKQHFYQQVTKDVLLQAPSDRAPQGALLSQQQKQTAQTPQIVPSGQSLIPSNYQMASEIKPTQAPQRQENQVLINRYYPAGPPEGSSTQPPTSCSQTSPDKQSFSAQSLSAPTSSASVTNSQPAMPTIQQEQNPAPLQTPQDAFGPTQNPYYYYRHPYDPYQTPYPQPYPPVDPRTAAHLYYQDVYGQYGPRYPPYDRSNAAYVEPGGYRYGEPERPSSRASQCSDRPPSRQGYTEDYYNSKSGWNDYYADYYANAYNYGDPSRWEHYPSAYDSRYRDPRSYDQRYWYDAEHNPYQKREAYPYNNRPDQYEDHWRYDPRFAGSFDDEAEPHRDPYGDEFDRRSVHSEHSAHSLRSSHSVHSRQSSFSSRSQQSQLYRSNHDLTANAYETTTQPVSLHTDYPYGGYPANFGGQQPFTDYGYPAETEWSSAEQVPSRPLTPEKFLVPHVCARFGPGGHLTKVLPNLPSEGQPALVEIHSMETMLQHMPEQEEMRAFPGPLAKDETHKVDVINFAQNRATQCFQNENLIDKESASLIWDFIVLLCRQNGTVVGTDIAELLLRDHKTVWLPGKSPNEANLIDFTNEALEQEESVEAQLSFLTDSLITTIDNLEKEIERFRELLLYGRKKDALESAMKHGLWGHALLLASKMDSRTHARVMTRFANSLPINDPLQTVYQLMSGRMPAASTCCGDEKWGDWRPHLAMVLSNLTNNMDVESRTITTMGDTLASKGLLDAAHFCYLMAQVGFGVYTKKTTKLVLLGSNHSLPFLKFATNEAIQRTEAYEYAQSLGTQPCCLPNFQVFKFIYACRLAEMGLAAQAFHYCEVISKTVLKNPYYYSPVLISQLMQISSQLRLFDPQIKEKPEQELFIEPSWLVRLRQLDGQIKDGTIAYNADRSTPQQYACSTPSSELDHVSQYDGTGSRQEVGPATENPLLASLLPNMVQHVPGVQLMPSAPQTILEGSAVVTPPAQQETVGGVPFYSPAPPSVGPGSGFAPPGFPNQYGAEQSLLYLGSTVPPGGPPPQAAETRQEEQFNQDTAIQRIPQESPVQQTFPEQKEEDFYGKMANMAPGRRSRSTSQSSAHMGYGRRSRTTSESSTHSVGRERCNSTAKQPSPPPPPPPSIPEGKETNKEIKKETAVRKGGANWFRWLMGKGKNEAHLPDDKNKSIVWDEKKQRWVDLDEPEEESKPPPPPPTGFPKTPQTAPPGPGGPPSVNMFSRRAAGIRARYVDILNPNGAKSSGAVPAPLDLFAPLAPMPIPANLFVPNSVPEEQQPLEGSGAGEQMTSANQVSADATADPQYLNSTVLPPGSELPGSNPDGSQSGEPLRSVPPSGGPPAGTVQFYNPSQFAQSPATTGSSRLGRIGQRKYPTLK